MKNPKIYHVSWILPPYRAMTVPPLGIFIKNRFKDDRKILNHELIHWKQCQDMGLFAFYSRYFFQKLTMGYDKMPMEMEARYEEDEYVKNHYSEVYFGSGSDKFVKQLVKQQIKRSNKSYAD